ncbi:MAG: 4-hydroxy-tetrahydrodipicolinate synthase [bacterium]
MLEGSMVALITPLKNDSIDERALRRLVRRQEDNGTDVLVPCGTTGESATLTYEEHKNVIEIVVDEADECSVMPGTGSNSTHEAIELSEHANEVGCDTVLVISPYYNCPEQHGMINHYETLANSVEVNIVLYNVPGRTGVNIDAETVIELAEHPYIVGVKEASGDLEQISKICSETPEDFAVLSGDDAMTLPLMAVGGSGVISVLANLVPSKVNDLVTAWHKGEPSRARQHHQELLPLMEAMFWETNPIPVKAGAAMLDLCESEIRSPMTKLSQEYREPLADELENIGLTVNEYE